jgi:enoyl-CoA hydratase/carnithine racemase
MFIRRGIIATSISFDLLPGIVGPAIAAEMLLTGEIVNAPQALQAGLVSRVVQADELMATALDLAAKIAANAPLAVERAKTGLNLKRDQKTDQMEQHLAESLRFLSGTEDHKESVAAFLEKRPAIYSGK